MVDWRERPDARGVEKSVLIRKQHWNVFESGRGEPLVFLHNGGGTLWNWAHQLEHFSTRYRVIAPDLPGFGRSHRSNEPLTLENYVRDLPELFEVLACRRPILVGNCIGSSIALEFALREPGEVGALALFNVCGGLPMLSHPLRFWATRRPRSFTGKFFHRTLFHFAGHPLARRVSATYLYAGSEPDLPPALLRFLREQRRDSEMKASLYPLISGLDSFSIFSQVRVKPANLPPVLLGWGKQNRTLDVKWAGVIADWLRPDQIRLIENAGHMPMYEQAELVNGILDGFLETLEKP